MGRGPADIRDFWDCKILAWEAGRYSPRRKGLFPDVNRPLKERMETAGRVLRTAAKDKVVLELGCGTARLLPAVMEAGAREYIGIDVSEAALREARGNCDRLGFSSRARFLRRDLRDLGPLSADLCFSLGFLDWLTVDEIKGVISGIDCGCFFHSFSERRFSLRQVLHRVYVYALYGYRSNGYVPRYHPEKTMEEVFRPRTKHRLSFYRARELSFCAFVCDFPEPGILRDG
ncbi:MAG: class I SAM-dependent methyltransferase [Candidatus Omnitrophota bacterium]|nr:class I SAM-dependent methyltransferase [Candidatus Omnitrophota bacterium]MDZ4241970.1 class I SAM-dependent methyltransferase [Candidatus Omnitrophota bacterium]